MVRSPAASGPASRSRTRFVGSAESLLARTHPAVPPPTMMKSSLFWLEGGEYGWRGVPAVSATFDAARRGATTAVWIFFSWGVFVIVVRKKRVKARHDSLFAVILPSSLSPASRAFGCLGARVG